MNAKISVAFFTGALFAAPAVIAACSGGAGWNTFNPKAQHYDQKNPVRDGGPDSGKPNPGPDASPGDGSADDAASPEPVTVDTAQIKSGVFTQVIDHTNPTSATFSQQYFYTTQFVQSTTAPVLLVLCGDWDCGPADAAKVGDSAQVLGAAIVSLEHRYYGKSQPHPNDVPTGKLPETLQDMSQLTVQNAVEDADAFVASMRASGSFALGNWIAVGAGYGGAIAAFLREQHPTDVAGAWASSAPVNVQFSSAGFDATCAHTLYDYSPTCLTLFQTALTAAAALDSGGEQTLWQNTFGSPMPGNTTPADFVHKFSLIAMSAVQSGDANNLCAALQNSRQTPLVGLSKYENATIDADAGPGIAPAEGPRSVQDKEAFDYERCTEIGGFEVQNSDQNWSVMSNLNDATYQHSFCENEFPHTSSEIATVNAQYYARLASGQASNILFVSGTHDPLSVSTFTDSSSWPTGTKLNALSVANGIEGGDMHNLQPNDPDLQVHRAFYALAQIWLTNPN